jgi:rhodanese-related sulfurtransferase
MPVPVGKGEVQALLAEGAWLLEVLDPDDYDSAHLPGARNIPAAELTRARVANVDPHWPVVVYGLDHQCDLAPRAARMLERYGFDAVYVYTGGKTDWLAFGLPHEGAGTLRVADLLERCLCASEEEDALAVRERIDSEGCTSAVVVDDGDIVLGSVARAALDGAEPGHPCAEYATLSPATVRPSETADTAARRMDAAGIAELLVTTSSGRLLGRLRRNRLRGSSPTLALAGTER